MEVVTEKKESETADRIEEAAMALGMMLEFAGEINIADRVRRDCAFACRLIRAKAKGGA